MTTRQQVVEQARKALGVKFRHQGRSLELGFDCVGLVIWSLKELGLHDYDFVHYAQRPADVETMSRVLNERMERIELAAVKPGDVLRFRLLNLPLHVGFATELGVIHATQFHDKVVEHRLDDKWRRRVVEAYRIPGIE